ncbi:MAG: methyl-accepting chemotaxis protein [Deltaproteobacteria bacterium]|nr:methyl-accepting chemotaxis protein [Deltaproteobacteria bacterium]MBW2078426.1 methyl-accepting chemotaxis protein [Deltaproteobacteria bacterium]MBW2311284.1 methyl-accepting chemotaxis protein [Deltaproteobacteria bacterium]
MKLIPGKRRQYIVNKSLQYRFLATILIYCFITVAFLSVYLFVPEIMRLEDESLSLQVRAVAADRILTFHSRIWPASIALICFLGTHSILFFHRVAGPLYRFHMAFERFRQGDMSFQVRIRRKDYLHTEEELINEMIEAIAGKLRTIQMASLGASKSWDEIEKKLSGWTEDDKKLLGVHRQQIETLVDTADYFRLKEEEQEPEAQGA